MESFDRAKGVLRLVSPKQQLFVGLRSARYKTERIKIHGQLKIAAGKELELEDAYLLLEEDSRFPLGDNRWLRVTVEATEHQEAKSPPVLVYAYSMAFEEQDANGQTVLLSAPRVTARPGQAFSVEASDGSEVYSFTYEP